ncbi:16S rRNA (guanine(527)-N(7))-methyltransferase RsmG [Anatilimnocola aggregata]|uniref:16S rRNA (guanine(527)-N(7))-methyltransferase RsmG n=1 Tax=Anatilimnocola aggregata TaxID=2528021 RepID=UPI00192E494D|nr:16S rRNA (guanine(527)-N(7))-methyltransferase RsmG [Anatilimnocola aggregata]
MTDEKSPEESSSETSPVDEVALDPAPAKEPAVDLYPNDTLVAALDRHQIQVQPDQFKLLEQYCRLLWDWNEKINLTRHTTYEKFVNRDLVDTLQLATLIHPKEEILDVGSGGGVPGITLAIMRPDLEITLSETTGKKARVLEDMVKQLKLPVTVFACRTESILDDTRYDALTARAVGPLWQLLTWFRPHWSLIGRLLLIKGPKWTEEQAEAKRRGLLRELELKVGAQYPMPGTDSDSVILKVWHQGGRER